MTTTYQDHYRLKPGGYAPGGKAKYDADDGEVPVLSNSLRKKVDISKKKSTEKDGGKTKPSPERTRKSEKAAAEKDTKSDDIGPPAVFYPVSAEWQRQKASRLNLSVKRTLTFGSQMRRFYPNTPPRKTEPVRGDGNCFFRAICAIITGSESDHMLVRKAVTQHVSDNPNMYRTFLESRGGMTKYLSSMKQSREWATDTEIMATATLLKTVIMVYFPCQIGSRFEYRWQTFKPLDNPEITHPVIYLTNKNEHFDPVLDVEEEPELNDSSQKPSGGGGSKRGPTASDSWNKF